jgi:hypothetical protein
VIGSDAVFRQGQQQWMTQQAIQPIETFGWVVACQVLKVSKFIHHIAHEV